MNDTPNSTAWRNLVSPSLVPGCAYGSRFPSLIVNVEGYPLSYPQRRSFATWLDDSLPDILSEWPAPDTSTRGDDWHDTVTLLLRAVHRIQEAARLTVFEESRILAERSNTARCQISISAAASSALVKALDWLFDCFNQWPDKPDHDALSAQLSTILEELGTRAYWSSNIRRFARAALTLGIPFVEMPGQIFQYGLGRRGRWMDGSITDQTPFISVGLVRNKQLAGYYLDRAGLPIAENQVVNDAESAVEAAEAIGYPVVVKPLDSDSGLGVAADLRTSEEVVRFFEAARQYSQNILIEKHFPGRDYRLVIFHGQMIWAIERIPGGVTGDGRHSVSQLVDQLNSNPVRDNRGNSPLKNIHLDNETLTLLARDQLTPESIPEAGRFVRLRRASNISTGGTPVGVFDQVHPDNRLLGERAASVLRLDIAGVDLLIDDISRSWRETGAIICEVNSRPNIGQTTSAHLYAPMMRQLVPGNGRVPVVLVLGAPEQSNLVEALGRALSGRLEMVVGHHDQQGVRINDQTISSGPVQVFEAARMLTMEPTVDAMIISVNDLSVAWTGLPMPRHDLLLIAGSHIDTGERTDKQTAITTLMNALLPGCDGKVLTLSEARLQIRAPSGLTDAEWVEEPVPAAQLVDRVIEIVAAAEGQHRQSPQLLEEQPVTVQH